MIFRHVGGSGHPLEPVLMILGIVGAGFEDFGDHVVILMANPVRKTLRFFSQNAAIDTLF